MKNEQRISDDEVFSTFTALGGQFILSPERIKEKISGIKAFVFDWDGVFNNGYKSENSPGLFAEPDAAGLNLLRYSYFLSNAYIVPCAIITGENNPGAVFFSKRECFSSVYMKVLQKPDAVLHFCHKNNITPEQIACVFDDINDISMAKMCGLRLMVGKKANPVFRELTVKNNWCDYITGCEQDKYPLREICELIMALKGSYEKSLLSRVAFDDSYKLFLNHKKSIKPSLFTAVENGFREEN